MAECPGEETLDRFITGALDAAAERDVKDHLDLCDACREVVAVVGREVQPSQRRSLPDDLLGGRYRLLRLLGQGGMGTVYEALDLTLDRPVAVKILREDTALDALARFRREAAAVAALRHPHIVQVTDVCLVSPRGAYLVMEKLEGESLRSIVSRDAPLAEDRVVSLGLQILSALGEAHARGLVHRDVKPENVFVTPTVALPDWARLLDFGLVKELPAAGEQPTLTSGHALVGTPAYMAPEQARGLPLDPRVDVFAVGVCMYEMLTGRRPFSGTGTALVASICADTPPPVGVLRPDVSPGLARIVERFLAKAPGERPDALEAARMLAQVTREVPPTIDDSHRPSSQPSREVRRRRTGQRRRSLLALFGAVLLFTLLVGGAALVVAFWLAGRAPVSP